MHHYHHQCFHSRFQSESGLLVPFSSLSASVLNKNLWGGMAQVFALH